MGRGNNCTFSFGGHLSLPERQQGEGRQMPDAITVDRDIKVQEVPLLGWEPREGRAVHQLREAYLSIEPTARGFHIHDPSSCTQQHHRSAALDTRVCCPPSAGPQPTSGTSLPSFGICLPSSYVPSVSSVSLPSHSDATLPSNC